MMTIIIKHVEGSNSTMTVIIKRTNITLNLDQVLVKNKYTKENAKATLSKKTRKKSFIYWWYLFYSWANVPSPIEHHHESVLIWQNYWIEKIYSKLFSIYFSNLSSMQRKVSTPTSIVVPWMIQIFLSHFIHVFGSWTSFAFKYSAMNIPYKGESRKAFHTQDFF